MSKLTWTPNPPTKPGWYWMKNARGVAECVRCDFTPAYVFCIMMPDGRPANRVRDCGLAWAGPIATPQEPIAKPLFRYALNGSYSDTSKHHWGWNEWEYDRAEVEARARRAVAPDGGSSSVTLIIQERRGGRWGRKTTQVFRAAAIAQSSAA